MNTATRNFVLPCSWIPDQVRDDDVGDDAIPTLLSFERQLPAPAADAQRLRRPLHFLVARRLRQLLARRQRLVGDAGAGAGDAFVAAAFVGAGADLRLVVHANLSSPVLMTAPQ